jgi:hypothetical protein
MIDQAIRFRPAPSYHSDLITYLHLATPTKSPCPASLHSPGGFCRSGLIADQLTPYIRVWGLNTDQLNQNNLL